MGFRNDRVCKKINDGHGISIETLASELGVKL